jgi:large subunit ribosomal protein L32
MPVPRRRHCSSRRDRGRTHKKLTATEGVVACEKCGKPRLPHRACSACGDYKGRHYGPVKAVSEK